MKINKRTFRIYLILTFLETIAFLTLLTKEPWRDQAALLTRRPLFFNITRVSLTLIALSLLTLLVLSRKKQRFFKTWQEKLTEKWIYGFLLLICSLILYEIVQDLLFLNNPYPAPFYLGYRKILQENVLLLVGLGAISLESLVLLVIINRAKWLDFYQRNKQEPGWLLILGVFGGLGAVFGLTGWGFIARPENLYTWETIGLFAPVNAPIPGVYLIAVSAAAAGIGFLICFQRERRMKLASFLTQRWVVFVLIGAAAFLLWNWVPVEGNYFVDTPQYAGYRIAPTSDAFYYEKQAQRLLVGEGFENDVTHGFYAYFLSLLHTLGGDAYADIIPLQIGVLVLIPYLLYRMSGLFGFRQGGIFLAFLYILRERNSLILGDVITVSNGQMLMTEQLTLVFLLAFLYFLIQWLQKPEGERVSAALAGMMIGLAWLIRIELIAVLFMVTIGSFIYLRKQQRNGLRGILIIYLTAALMVMPWVFRNWQKTGQISLHNENYLEETVEFYNGRGAGEERIKRADLAVDKQSDKEKIGTVGKAFHHLANSMTNSVLHLPINHQPLLTVGSLIGNLEDIPHSLIPENHIFSEPYLTRYVRSLPYWWYDWDGDLEPRSVLPLALCLAVISMGLWRVYQKHSGLAFIPWLTYLGHIGIYAVFGRSGGRFIKIVDWVPLMYFCVGAVTIFNKWANHQPIPQKGSIQSIDYRKKTNSWAGYGLIIICLGLAFSLPVVEAVIPPQYPEGGWQVKTRDILTTSRVDHTDQIRQMEEEIKRSGASVSWGKALYPRFFKRKEQIQDDRKGTLPRAYTPRIDFYLVGEQNIWISLPHGDPTEVFPHHSEVIVLGYLTRDDNLWLGRGYQPFLKASKIYIFEEVGDQITIKEVSCLGESCFP